MEALKRGEEQPEIINGEIKLQFDEGVNLMDIASKPIPFIKVTITNFANDEKGGIKPVEESQYSAPCVGFREKYNFNKAVRINFIKKDKVKILLVTF